MKTAKAFAPANISCIFVVKQGAKPITTGSLGVGFTLDKGVIVRVSENKKNGILFNGKNIALPTVSSVVSLLTDRPIKVDITSAYGLGTGFGVSGACALATVYALNKLLGYKKSQKELAHIAHCAEVQNGTGLGDVTNQFFGGVLLKKKSSAKFEVQKISTSKKTLHYRCFGKLETKSVIGNKRKKERIEQSGKQALKKIQHLKSKTLENLLDISFEFAVNSKLMSSKVEKTIGQIHQKGGHASMIMLGDAVMSTVPFPGSRKMTLSTKKAMLL